MKKFFKWLGIIGGGAAAAIVIAKQPHGNAPASPPPSTPAPTSYSLFVHVCDDRPCESGNEPYKLPGASVTFGGQQPTSADAAGNAIALGFAQGRYEVCATMAGYADACETVQLPRADADGGQDVFLVLSRLIPPVQPIRVDGKVFRSADGALWQWRGVTAFTLMQDVVRGVDVGPYLEARRLAGANLARVLMTMVNITDLRPEQYTDGQIGALLAAAHARGLRLELVALADAEGWPLSKQQAQVQRVVDVVAANGCLDVVEVANEPFPGKGNAAAPADIVRGVRKPACVLMASGVYDPPEDSTSMFALDFITFHSSRDAEWPRKAKDGQDYRDGFDWASGKSFPGIGKPVVDDEPMGADETDQPGKRSNNPNDFYWLGATASMMSAGATFHSTAGITDLVPGPVTTTAEQSFFAGLSAVPTETQTWLYTRGGLSNNPLAHTDLPDPAGALRTFCKLSGGDAWCVAIRPGPQWVATAVGGWHIASQTGPRGSVIHLQR